MRKGLVLLGWLMLVVVCGFVMAGSLDAQEATASPLAEEVLLNDGTSVMTPASGSAPMPTVETFDQIIRLVALVVGSFVAGGATVGGTVLLVVRTISSSPAIKSFIESLFLSQPIEQRQIISNVIRGVDEAVELAKAVTDGDINADVALMETRIGKAIDRKAANKDLSAGNVMALNASADASGSLPSGNPF